MPDAGLHLRCRLEDRRSAHPHAPLTLSARLSAENCSPECQKAAYEALEGLLTRGGGLTTILLLSRGVGCPQLGASRSASFYSESEFCCRSGAPLEPPTIGGQDCGGADYNL